MAAGLRVLIVGSGGREHALAWKVAPSPLLGELFVAPGNAGTAALAENVPLAADDVPGLTTWAAAHTIDLVIVGPEVALAAGLADALSAVHIAVFGPSRAAAEIESSKAFAKDFMRRHNLPTAAYGTYTDFYAAVGHL